jgi:hypothetical protein
MSNVIGAILLWGACAWWVAVLAYLIYFCRGPLRASEARIAGLLANSRVPWAQTAYRQRVPRVRWPLFFLLMLVSPVLGYLYLGRALDAGLCAGTMYGFGIWGLLAPFLLPRLALEYNEWIAQAVADGYDVERAWSLLMAGRIGWGQAFRAAVRR